MKFKDVFLINERKVELDGKIFKSEKEAGFYLGSIGKTYQEIMKLLDVPERMAKYYANTWKQNWKNKPVEPTPEPKPIPVVPPPTPERKISPEIDLALKKLEGKFKEPIVVHSTALPIKFDSKLDIEKMKKPIDDHIYQATFEKELITRKDGSINFTFKNETFAVAMINGKPIYTTDDVPNVPSINADLTKVAPMLAQNQQGEVVSALRNLPQHMIDLLSKSKTFKNRRVFIKSSEKKTGGWCKPSMYEIFWGKGRKYAESNFNTLRHEMMHMWEGDQYNITYKIPDIATRSDILRMKTPSIALENKVNEILDKTDYGLHRTEANKILAHYDLTVEELETFVSFDKSYTFDLKPRGAFAFALYLSQGDLTNAMKSLYQTQMIGFDGQVKWVNMITHTELVYNCFSDFIGSLTQNKILGRKHGGSGHTNAYYKQRSQLRSKNCELIAQYGAIVGCGENVIARKILKAFAPYTVNAIETILKTQTYFDHEGNDVNYI